MTTPWERELEEKRRKEEEAHLIIQLTEEQSKKLSRLPWVSLSIAVPVAIIVFIALLVAYSQLVDSMGLTLTGSSRRRYDNTTHPVTVLLLFIPFFAAWSAFGARYLVMHQVAEELGRKVNRKVKGSENFQKALIDFFIRTPWSEARLRRFVLKVDDSPYNPFKGYTGIGISDTPANTLHRITTKYGESRTLEFSDDMSFMVIGPTGWFDPPSRSVGDFIFRDGKVER